MAVDEADVWIVLGGAFERAERGDGPGGDVEHDGLMTCTWRGTRPTRVWGPTRCRVCVSMRAFGCRRRRASPRLVVPRGSRLL